MAAGFARFDEPSNEIDRVAYETIGAAIEVHRVLGPGFLESTYEEALCDELSLRKIPFVRQVTTPVYYKNRCVGEVRLDLIVARALVLELKATEGLSPVHWAQLLSYLRATDLRLGLLINFNVSELRRGIKRIVHKR